jgi:hypothetical protein
LLVAPRTQDLPLAQVLSLKKNCKEGAPRLGDDGMSGAPVASLFFARILAFT